MKTLSQYHLIETHEWRELSGFHRMFKNNKIFSCFYNCMAKILKKKIFLLNLVSKIFRTIYLILLNVFSYQIFGHKKFGHVLINTASYRRTGR